jgi:2-desacetyl-2-hydroxyethyl bacteriochlorophyllide A dehydrogenase
MRAVLCKRYGSAEVLELATVERPKLKKNRVMIRVRAAEVTKADCELRSFNFAVKWFSVPLRLAFGLFRPRNPILGGYFAGEIVEVGEGVSRFSIGDKVYGSSGFRMGAYGEYLTLPESASIVRMPSNISFEEAAATPLGALNALHFLSLAEVQEGESILINGAGGSIGLFAIQIAKTMGAKVTAVDAGHKRELIESQGVEHFINYQSEDIWASDQSWDVMFDMVPNSLLDKCIRKLSKGGRYITANPTFKKMISAGKVFKKTGKKVIVQFAGETTAELEQVSTLLEQGKIKTPIDHVYPLQEVIEAHQRVESEARCGCVVLQVSKY